MSKHQTAPQLQHLRVLVVDDNQDMRLLMRRMLASLGIKHISEATDGWAALTILGESGFDVIFSDLEMKPMNGIDFTREVRTSRHCSNSIVPIIMVTGRTEMQLVQTARDSGITEFIVKPVSTKALQSRLTEIVERPRPFVRKPSYVGPDRRRKRIDGLASRRREDLTQ